MDFFQIALLLGISAGLTLVLVSYSGKKETKSSDVTQKGDFSETLLEKRIEAMDSSISEADSVLAELGDMSKTIFKELDVKYNELLFLYNLIDEKKNEVNSAGRQTERKITAHTSKDFENQRLAKILELKRDGLSLDQIAKKLGMGQGEVALIMNLFDYSKK